jgi:DNA-binding NtrC family response regulator
MPEQGRRRLVFVVDDEPAIATTVTYVLRNRGFDARAFTQPIAALEAAQNEAPDLLLSDVIMPRLNGFELGAGIKKDCPQCKVLLFSGHPQTSELITTDGNNFEVLAKPLHPEAMLNAIERKLHGTSPDEVGHGTETPD